LLVGPGDLILSSAIASNLRLAEVPILLNMATSGQIRVGIGGWSYAPWRETFYPPEVPKKDELRYASRRVTAIEVNSTFYRLQQPHVFAKWRDETPESFVFSLKAPRFVAQRKVLADAGPFIERFIGSGITELGAKLGPLLWQLAPTQAFNPDDLRAFLDMLPQQAAGLKLRHAIEVRHASFRHPEFPEIAQQHGVAIVFEDDDEYPAIAELTSDFVYARLRRCSATEPTGYSATALAHWLERSRCWARGTQPADLPSLRQSTVASRGPCDVFVFFINGAKERAPAAAQAFIAGVGTG
jgi:uncharacterized protein YecE (DUF72 family)